MLFLLFIKSNVVLICSPVNGMDEHIHERTVQLARLKATCYLDKLTKDLEPDKNEFYEYLPFSIDNLSCSIFRKIVLCTYVTKPRVVL